MALTPFVYTEEYVVPGGAGEGGGVVMQAEKGEDEEGFGAIEAVDEGDFVFTGSATLVHGGDEEGTGEIVAESFTVPFEGLAGGVAKHSGRFDVNRGSGRA